MSQLISSLFINIVLLCLAKSLFADSVCGDWHTYKDEKCFRIFDALQSYDEATNTCIQHNATLVTISSLEEQQFIETFLFTTYKIVENVWIGLKYANSQYKWINESAVVYTNWSEGSPKNKTDYCVQIDSDEGFLAKWSDVSCSKKNLALCQKLPTISVQKLFDMFLKSRKQLENSLLQQNVTNLILENTNKRLNTALNELSATNEKLEIVSKQFDYFFSDKIIHFKTFAENKTRKALIYPFKSFVTVLRSEAIELCAKYNATLVDIESLEKQKLIEAFLYQINPNLENRNFFIGAFSESTGKYKWLNSGTEFKYTNWYPGYPQNDKQVYLCFYSQYGDSNDGKWWSITISETCNVFCELTV